MRTTTSIVAASVLSSALTAFFISGSDRTASARSAPIPQDLGPADALVLVGKSDLRVTNADGRISWSDQPSSRAFSIGTVHVSRIMEALLRSDKFSSERDDFNTARQKKGAEFESRYKEMVEKAQAIDKASPEFPAMREQFQAFQQEFTQWNEGAERELRELVTQQYQSAYSNLREAVEVVADRRKIDLVMRFVPATEKIVAGDESAIAQQLLARTFLRFPESIEMTEDVLSEMNIQAPKKD